jgi:hypothetical protein
MQLQSERQAHLHGSYVLRHITSQRSTHARTLARSLARSKVGPYRACLVIHELTGRALLVPRLRRVLSCRPRRIRPTVD